MARPSNMGDYDANVPQSNESVSETVVVSVQYQLVGYEKIEKSLAEIEGTLNLYSDAFTKVDKSYVNAIKRIESVSESLSTNISQIYDTTKKVNETIKHLGVGMDGIKSQFRDAAKAAREFSAVASGLEGINKKVFNKAVKSSKQTDEQKMASGVTGAMNSVTTNFDRFIKSSNNVLAVLPRIKKELLGAFSSEAIAKLRQVGIAFRDFSKVFLLFSRKGNTGGQSSVFGIAPGRVDLLANALENLAKTFNKINFAVTGSNESALRKYLDQLGRVPFNGNGTGGTLNATTGGAGGTGYATIRHASDGKPLITTDDRYSNRMQQLTEYYQRQILGGNGFDSGSYEQDVVNLQSQYIMLGETAVMTSSGFNLLGQTISNAGAQLHGMTMRIQSMSRTAMNAFADSDYAIRSLVTVAGENFSVVGKKVGEEIQKVMTNTTFNRADVVQGLQSLVASGFSTQQALGAYRQVDDFSMASGLAPNVAAESLIDSATALNWVDASTSVDDLKNRLATLSDTMVYVERISTASIDDVMQGFQAASGTVRLMGMNVKTLGAVIAGYASQGRKGSEAGEALARAMRLVSNSAVNNADAFKKYNIEIYDSSGNMNNFIDIIGQFEKAFSGLSSQQRTIAFEEMGMAALQQRDITPLLGKSGIMKSYETQLGSDAIMGSTAEKAKVLSESFSASINKMKNNIDNLLITLGGKFVGTFSSATGVVSDMAVIVDKIITAFDKLSAGIIGDVIGKLGTFAITLGIVITALGSTAGSVVMLYSGWQQISSVLGSINVLGTTARVIFTRFSLSLISGVGIIILFSEEIKILSSILRTVIVTIGSFIEKIINSISELIIGIGYYTGAYKTMEDVQESFIKNTERVKDIIITFMKVFTVVTLIYRYSAAISAAYWAVSLFITSQVAATYSVTVLTRVISIQIGVMRALTLVMVLVNKVGKVGLVAILTVVISLVAWFADWLGLMNDGTEQIEKFNDEIKKSKGGINDLGNTAETAKKSMGDLLATFTDLRKIGKNEKILELENAFNSVKKGEELVGVFSALNKHSYKVKTNVLETEISLVKINNILNDMPKKYEGYNLDDMQKVMTQVPKNVTLSSNVFDDVLKEYNQYKQIVKEYEIANDKYKNVVKERDAIRNDPERWKKVENKDNKYIAEFADDYNDLNISIEKHKIQLDEVIKRRKLLEDASGSFVGYTISNEMEGRREDVMKQYVLDAEKAEKYKEALAKKDYSIFKNIDKYTKMFDDMVAIGFSKMTANDVIENKKIIAYGDGLILTQEEINKAAEEYRLNESRANDELVIKNKQLHDIFDFQKGILDFEYSLRKVQKERQYTEDDISRLTSNYAKQVWGVNGIMDENVIKLQKAKEEQKRINDETIKYKKNISDTINELDYVLNNTKKIADVQKMVGSNLDTKKISEMLQKNMSVDDIKTFAGKTKETEMFINAMNLYSKSQQSDNKAMAEYVKSLFENKTIDENMYKNIISQLDEGVKEVTSDAKSMWDTILGRNANDMELWERVDRFQSTMGYNTGKAKRFKFVGEEPVMKKVIAEGNKIQENQEKKDDAVVLLSEVLNELRIMNGTLDTNISSVGFLNIMNS